MDKQEIDKLVAQLEADHPDTACEVLDDFVHDAMSARASTINNGGLREQVKFLLSEGYTPEQLTEQM